MNFYKCYDVNSLFLFWKSFFSKQQANIYYYISISLIKSLFLDRLRNDIHQIRLGLEIQNTKRQLIDNVIELTYKII